MEDTFACAICGQPSQAAHRFGSLLVFPSSLNFHVLGARNAIELFTYFLALLMEKMKRDSGPEDGAIQANWTSVCLLQIQWEDEELWLHAQIQRVWIATIE